MGSWLLERRLTQTSSRLKALREELAMVDEQLRSLADEADDLALRALMSETPSASFESNDARRHAEAMDRHRRHITESIVELHKLQDELLDKLSARTARTTR